MSFHPPGPQFPRLQNGRKNIYSRGPCGNGTGGHTEPRVRRACGRGGCKQSRAVGPDSGHLAPRSCWPASVPEANPAHPLALDMAKKIIGPQPVGRNPEKQTDSPVARRCRRLRLQAGPLTAGRPGARSKAPVGDSPRPGWARRLLGKNTAPLCACQPVMKRGRFRGLKKPTPIFGKLCLIQVSTAFPGRRLVSHRG